jgi:hypothetical protein
MRVFVSWADVSIAEEAETARLDWVEKAKKSKAAEDKQFAATLSPTLCLPEYHEYLQTIKQQEGAFAQLDPLNRNILAIRFVVPALEKVVTYQLAKRVPGDNKLSVSLAARAFLLNTFPGEWVGEANPKHVVFVGMQGLKHFMQRFAYACGALGQPLPSSLWLDSPQLELADAISARELMESCAFAEPIEENKRKYLALTQGWMGIGASSDRDSSLLTATSFRLGF